MAKRKPLTCKQKRNLRRVLLERRHALSEAFRRGVSEAPEARLSWPADEEEAGRVIGNTEMQYVIAGIHAATLAEVESALSKLQDGTYGRCESCGELIRKARLRVQPFASLCVTCKGAAERQQAARNDGSLAVAQAPVLSLRPPAEQTGAEL